MKKQFLVVLILALFFSASAQADVSFNGGGGGGGSSFTLPGGGTANSLPQVFSDFVAGSGKTLTVPTGTVKMEFLICGSGAGGGGAPTGGTAAVCGGTGGSGNCYQGILSGTAATQAITYSLGAAGAAPGCGASATQGGSGAQSSISVGGVSLGNTSNVLPTAGANATTTTAGAGGGAPTLLASHQVGLATNIAPGVSLYNQLVGIAGTTGAADVLTLTAINGTPGGQGACVTAAGACDGALPGSAGTPGYLRVIFYFQ